MTSTSAPPTIGGLPSCPELRHVNVVASATASALAHGKLIHKKRRVSTSSPHRSPGARKSPRRDEVGDENEGENAALLKTFVDFAARETFCELATSRLGLSSETVNSSLLAGSRAKREQARTALLASQRRRMEAEQKIPLLAQRVQEQRTKGERVWQAVKEETTKRNESEAARLRHDAVAVANGGVELTQEQLTSAETLDGIQRSLVDRCKELEEEAERLAQVSNEIHERTASLRSEILRDEAEARRVENSARAEAELELPRREQLSIMKEFIEAKRNLVETLSGVVVDSVQNESDGHHILLSLRVRGVLRAARETGISLMFRKSEEGVVLQKCTVHQFLTKDGKLECEAAEEAVRNDDASGFIRRLSVMLDADACVERDLQRAEHAFLESRLQSAELSSKAPRREKGGGVLQTEWNATTREVTVFVPPCFSASLRVPVDYPMSPPALLKLENILMLKDYSKAIKSLQTRMAQPNSSEEGLDPLDLACWVQEITKKFTQG